MFKRDFWMTGETVIAQSTITVAKLALLFFNPRDFSVPSGQQRRNTSLLAMI